MAIEHAHRVLDWQENLAGDELPPAWMWPFDTELTVWFEDVEEKRNEKYGNSSSSSSGDDSSAPMMKNELSKR